MKMLILCKIYAKRRFISNKKKIILAFKVVNKGLFGKDHLNTLHNKKRFMKKNKRKTHLILSQPTHSLQR